MNSIAERFEKIWWHDSKLLGLSFHRNGGEDQIKLSLELVGEGGRMTPAEVMFKDCAYVEANIYLQAKRLCADDIAGAECNVSSDWKNSVSEPGPYDPIQGDRRLDDYLHFRVSLCAPGGDIDILARDFVLVSVASA